MIIKDIWHSSVTWIREMEHSLSYHVLVGKIDHTSFALS